jgi:hypothetical protein
MSMTFARPTAARARQHIHASHVHVRRAAIPADRTFVLILWLRCPSSTFSAFSASSFYSKEKPRARA